MIYLDASALVTLLVGRLHAKELDRFLDTHAEARTCTSTIGFVETVRTCDQIGAFPHLMASLLQDHAEILLTDEIRDAAGALTGGIRTLDAIHVASAEVLGTELTALVTYDIRMADAARAAGLPVVMPGVE
jgi:predicted nucleic acid-binding protein